MGQGAYTILLIANGFLKNLVIPGGTPCVILLENVEGRSY